MDKNKRPKIRYFAPLLLLLGAITGLLYSCRKDFSSVVTNDKPSLIDPASYQSVFNSAILSKGGLKKSNSFDEQKPSPIITSSNVLWDTGVKYKLDDSTNVTEFSVKSDSALIALDAIEGNRNSYNNKTTAVFIEKKNGVKIYFFMKAIEDRSDSNTPTTLANLHYRKVPSSFTGLIMFFSFDRKFLNGYTYAQGSIAGRVSFNALPSQKQVQSVSARKKISTDNCGYFLNLYRVVCEWAGTSEDPYQDFHGCANTFIGSVFIQCSGGGGGTTSPGGTGDGGNNPGGGTDNNNPGGVNGDGGGKDGQGETRDPDGPKNSVTFGSIRSYLCGYYPNQSTGSSFTGTIDGLGFTVIFNNSITIPISYGSSCWEIPSYGINSNDASNLFIAAYNSALTELYPILIARGPDMGYSGIYAEFLLLLELNLNVVRRGSSFSTGPCSGIYPVKQATFCETP